MVTLALSGPRMWPRRYRCRHPPAHRWQRRYRRHCPARW